MTNEDIETQSRRIGQELARWLFARRGNRAEVHLSEVDLAALLALASERSFRQSRAPFRLPPRPRGPGLAEPGTGQAGLPPLFPPSLVTLGIPDERRGGYLVGNRPFLLNFQMVGATGFEPATTCTPSSF